MSEQPRKRLVADRFRRVWHIVEDIAAHPGQTRRQLADKFHLSERQIQADLNIIKHEMGMPLVRRQGYRFADDGVPGLHPVSDLREAQLLVLILRQSMKDRSIPKDRLASLMAKLPGMFPSHLQPLVQRTLQAVTAPPSPGNQVVAALADATLRAVDVRLHYAPDSWEVAVEPVIRPEMLIPYLDGWYVVGACRQRNDQSRMFRLDSVVAVTQAADGRGA